MDTGFLFCGYILMGSPYLKNGFIVTPHDHGAPGTGGTMDFYREGICFCDLCARDVSPAVDPPGVLPGVYGDVWMGDIGV